MAEAETSLLRDAAADDEIVADTKYLLTCYQEALDAANRSPVVRFIPLSDRGFGRRVPVPRLRFLLQTFMVLHITGTVASLKRRLHREAVKKDDPNRFENEIKLLERFERSLPPVASRRLVVSVTVIVLLAAYGIAFSMSESKGADLEPFKNLVSSVFQVDRGGVVDALDEYSWLTAYFTALGVAVSVWLVLMLPMTSFQLKRTVFNLVPGAEKKLPRTTIAKNRHELGGIYDLEEALFSKLETTPPRELRFDLLVEALLIVLTIGLVVYTVGDLLAHRDKLSVLWPPTRGGAQLFVTVGLGALLLLRLFSLSDLSHARREPTQQRHPQQRAEAVADFARASWGRRFGAWLIDAALIGGVWILLGSLLSDGETVTTADTVLTFTILLFPVVYATVCHGRSGRTVGKRVVGISVRCATSLERLGYRRAFVRWLVTLIFWIPLVLPGLLDAFWPLWDKDEKRQAWHDKVVNSTVIRPEKN